FPEPAPEGSRQSYACAQASGEDSVKIALVSSEIVPFSKTGGLADVTGALGKYLWLDGVDVRLFTPLYDTAEVDLEALHAVDYLQDLWLDIGDRRLSYSVFTTRLP